MRFYANSMADLCEALGRDVSQLVVPLRGEATTGDNSGHVLQRSSCHIHRLWAGLRNATQSVSRVHLEKLPYRV